MKHEAGVYVITLQGTTKVYVGSSANMMRRWDQHRAKLRSGKHHSRPLQNAWNKYGEESFKWSILQNIAPVDNKKELGTALVSAEDYWMALFATEIGKPPAFNVAPKAGTVLGVLRTPETCARISASKKGRPGCKGRKLTTEHKEKLRGPKSAETKEKLRRPKSAETKEKMRVAARARVSVPRPEATEVHKMRAKQIVVAGIKRCADCGDTKALTEFHRSKAILSGFYSYCKLCIRAKTAVTLLLKR